MNASKSLYPHCPFWWVTLCLGSGIMINEYFQISFLLLSGFSALCLLVSLLIHDKKASLLLLFMSVIFLGAVYSQNYQTFPKDHIYYLSRGYYPKPLWVEGRIVSDVEKRPFFKRKKTAFTFAVQRIGSKNGWKEKRGNLLVHIFHEGNLSYGDHLILEGRLHKPFNFLTDGQFSYQDYLYRKGITLILSVKKQGYVRVLQKKEGQDIRGFLLHLKKRLNTVLENNFPKEEASLMQALLLGDRYNIPKNVYELFKISGVAHIIAISGFNIGIVAYVIFLILKIFPIPRKGQYLLTILLLIFYAMLTGGQPPVVRATIMAVVFLISLMVERQAESINTLSLAALMILLMNPLNLFDVGFQLSFISVLSILILYPQLMNMFFKIWPGLMESDGQNEPHKPGFCPLKVDKIRPKGRLIKSPRDLIKLVGVNPKLALHHFVAGISTSPWFQCKIWDKPKGSATIKVRAIKYLVQSLALSLSAYCGVVVLIAYYFHLVTPIVILANLVAIPLTSMIICLGIGLLLAGWIFPPVTFLFANCIQVLLNMMVASVFLFVKIPGAYFELNSFPLSVVIFCYALMVMLFLKGNVARKIWEQFLVILIKVRKLFHERFLFPR